jgi:hypothetical protein
MEAVMVALLAAAAVVIGLIAGVAMVLGRRLEAAQRQVEFLQRRMKFREGMNEMLQETDRQEQVNTGRF